jgi:hypothetical protein
VALCLGLKRLGREVSNLMYVDLYVERGGCTQPLLDGFNFHTHFFFVALEMTVFWDVTPCRFGNRLRHAPSFLVVSCLAYSSTMEMEVTCSSETPIDIHRTGRYNSS